MKILVRIRLWMSWLYINVLPGVAVTLVVLGVLAWGGELYLRAKLPFNEIIWAAQFDERFGWNFTPGTTVKFTNHTEFWTLTEVNSIGFLDRPPPSPEKRPGVCRIAFIGDSYIEAAHVPIDKKFHVVFERLAMQQSQDGQAFETVAVGQSGTGQFNQLPFYDIFARQFTPDVVVLVFTGNDFANNSAVLESVRYGWHPLHPPKLFYERDPKTGTFTPIPIDPSWQDRLLATAPGELAQPPAMVSWLTRESYLYNWLYSGFLKSSPGLNAWLTGNPLPLVDVYRHRMHEISKDPKYSGVFDGWDPEEADMDSVFTRENLPPLFEEAIAMTGHAFDEFQERAGRDGFGLLVFSETHASKVYDGKRLSHDRLKKLLADRGIPLIDQYDYITAKGLDLSALSFPRDRHWNEQGHEWAAEALLEYFKDHPEVCR